MAEPALIQVLSDAEVGEIEEECAHLPDRKSAAIDAMMIVQRHRGWVSDESLSAIAQLLGMSVENLDSIATFYNLIYRKPVGRHVVMVCDSVSCYVMGADGLRKAVEQHLGIGLGEMIDGRRPVHTAADRLPRCMRSCTHDDGLSSGRDDLIDDELIGDVTAEKLGETFARFE